MTVIDIRIDIHSNTQTFAQMVEMSKKYDNECKYIPITQNR